MCVTTEFNIFYPDLIDKNRAPTYKIIKNKENEDVATLLFKAGPPYEDIAFTIVNKDWEHSHKRGFRSSFDRGVSFDIVLCPFFGQPFLLPKLVLIDLTKV